MEQRLTIITLGVKDLAKSTHFYEHTFGWRKADSSNENISFFTLNGILLSPFEKEALAADAGVASESRGFNGFTLAYNTRSEKEVDDLIGSLKDKGVNIVKEPQKAHWGGYSSYVSDIDDNLWEIAYNPYLALDKNGNVV